MRKRIIYILIAATVALPGTFTNVFGDPLCLCHQFAASSTCAEHQGEKGPSVNNLCCCSFESKACTVPLDITTPPADHGTFKSVLIKQSIDHIPFITALNIHISFERDKDPPPPEIVIYKTSHKYLLNCSILC